MDEIDEFAREAISGMTKKILSLEEVSLKKYESWLKTAIKVAFMFDDKSEGVSEFAKTMTTPSSLFYMGFIHGYAHRGSEMQKTNGSETQ